MRAGRSSYLKVEGVQVSGILYLTGPGVSVCIRPIIGDLCPQFCHDTSNMWLNTREPPVSAVKVMYAAGVEGGGGNSAKGVSSNTGKYVEVAGKKSGLSAICYTEEGSVHVDMLLMLLPLIKAAAGGGADDHRSTEGLTLRSRVRELECECKHPFEVTVHGCLSKFKTMCLFEC